MSNCFCHLNNYEVKDPKARPCDNVASMKARTDFNSGDVISTKGYYTPNDGGGANYLITERGNETEDNGSIILVGTDKTANLIGEMINVKQFGAKGDGTTDDTVAIQKALNYGRFITFSNGTFKITDELIPLSNTYIFLNNANIVSYSTNITKAIFKLSNVSNVTIDGGTISYNTLIANQFAIKLDNTSNCKITRVIFGKQATAILLGNSTTYTFIKDNVVAVFLNPDSITLTAFDYLNATSTTYLYVRDNAGISDVTITLTLPPVDDTDNTGSGETGGETGGETPGHNPIEDDSGDDSGGAVLPPVEETTP